MSSELPYKIAILAAGRGSRLGALTQNVNKALLPINYQAVITRILNNFPAEVSLVIAVGYQQDKLREYLSVVHSERNIQYVSVDNITGPGAGPGYSLLKCQRYLQEPFVITTVDTITLENVPPPSVNWLGVAPVPIGDIDQYNSVNIKDGFINQMNDKEKCQNTHAFIGLAGIKDYQEFWTALAGDHTLINNERQLSNGLRKLIDVGLAGVEFTWFDTGNVAGLKKASNQLTKDQPEEFDFSKTDEYLYFVGDKVVKYFSDREIVGKRVARARQMTKVMPKIEDATSHFFSYRKIPGQTVYQDLSPGVIKELFNWLQEEVWHPLVLNKEDLSNFRQACWKFYHDKTITRLTKFYQITNETDLPVIVNDQPLPKLSQLLSQIDWAKLTEGIPSTFHGDLQFDNILVTKDQANQFMLIDWRQDFAGLTEYGDLYYDLAKLNGGLIIPYHLIKKNMFSFTKTGQQINFDIGSTHNLWRGRQLFEQFVATNGYDLNKINLLTALIFLNMSPLHNQPFNLLLYYFGRLELAQALNYE